MLAELEVLEPVEELLVAAEVLVWPTEVAEVADAAEMEPLDWV